MQCILEISLKKIKSNWKKINIYSNFKASAVVKANAYGFGLEEIALALNQSGCNFFYVAQIEEGIKLRNCLKSDKASEVETIFAPFLSKASTFPFSSERGVLLKNTTLSKPSASLCSASRPIRGSPIVPVPITMTFLDILIPPYIIKG